MTGKNKNTPISAGPFLSSLSSERPPLQDERVPALKESVLRFLVNISLISSAFQNFRIEGYGYPL